jgi:hypothetical protein
MDWPNSESATPKHQSAIRTKNRLSLHMKNLPASDGFVFDATTLSLKKSDSSRLSRRGKKIVI